MSCEMVIRDRRITPKYLPSLSSCGKRFDVGHAMSCMKGSFIYRRHDDVPDMLANRLKDACHDFQVEPHLHIKVLASGAN